MLKSTVLYRRYWYIKRRNGKYIRLYIRLLTFLVILSMLVFFTNKNLFPNLMEISELKARAAITDVITSTVNNVFNSETGYEELITVKRSEHGDITLIETDMAKLNSLTSRIIHDVGNRLSLMSKLTISMPMGALLGNTIFAGMGPEVNVNVQADESIEASIESQFLGAGINQTKHRIVLRIKTDIKVSAPLGRRNIEMWTEIPLSETIIVGKIPQIYSEGIAQKYIIPEG